MFQFCYTLSEKDYFELNMYHAFNSPALKKRMLVYRFVSPMGFVVIGLIVGLIVVSPSLTYYYYFSFGIAAILWMIFFRRIMAYVITKNIREIKKGGKMPYGENVTSSFEDDFYVGTTESEETKVKYSAIERVIIAEKAVYIYINALQAIILPFTIFSNEQEFDDFIVFIKKKCAGCV